MKQRVFFVLAVATLALPAWSDGQVPVEGISQASLSGPEEGKKPPVPGVEQQASGVNVGTETDFPSITLVTNGWVEVREILGEVASQAGLGLQLAPDVGGKVNVHLVEVPVERRVDLPEASGQLRRLGLHAPSSMPNTRHAFSVVIRAASSAGTPWIFASSATAWTT